MFLFYVSFLRLFSTSLFYVLFIHACLSSALLLYVSFVRLFSMSLFPTSTRLFSPHVYISFAHVYTFLFYDLLTHACLSSTSLFYVSFPYEYTSLFPTCICLFCPIVYVPFLRSAHTCKSLVYVSFLCLFSRPFSHMCVSFLGLFSQLYTSLHASLSSTFLFYVSFLHLFPKSLFYISFLVLFSPGAVVSFLRLVHTTISLVYVSFFVFPFYVSFLYLFSMSLFYVSFPTCV